MQFHGRLIEGDNVPVYYLVIRDQKNSVLSRPRCVNGLLDSQDVARSNSIVTTGQLIITIILKVILIS